MTARLATALYVNALTRRVTQMGGMAAVVRKGDETAGALILLTREKGANTGIWERAWTADGAYTWAQITAQIIEKDEEISHFLDRRLVHDPDLWVVELDIANAARFAVEMDSVG